MLSPLRNAGAILSNKDQNFGSASPGKRPVKSKKNTRKKKKGLDFGMLFRTIKAGKR